MYKMFKELEYLNNYKTSLIDNRIQNKSISLNYLPSNIDIRDILKRLDIIDKIIYTLNSKLTYAQKGEIFLYTEEELNAIYSFFNEKEEFYSFTKYIFNKIDLSVEELIFLIYDYCKYLPYLKSIYPKYGEFLQTTEEKFNEFIKKMNLSITIPKKLGIEYTWPNAWFITPHEYLYNSDGEDGHKEANLKYSYLEIKSLLSQNKTIPSFNCYQNPKEIANKTYITSQEFKNYANLIYELPEIPISLNSSESEKRSYQPNIIKLITGYLDAKKCFYNSFIKLNTSPNKQKHINKISELTEDNIADILVRFAKFAKIESSIPHTITTSSIKATEEFQEYLDNGWTIQIIPPIVYDKYIDKISSCDLNSYFIQKYFDSQLTNYKGKGRVIIKK